MNKLKLRDITLVAVETREHSLMRLAIEDCLKVAEFDDVLVFTDRPLEFSPLTHFCKPRIITVSDWPSKVAWCRAVWFDVPPHVHTSHMLLLQWDACIWRPEMWREEFKAYDLIGAPWTWHSNKRVGNTGFGLKSTRLARYVRAHRDRYPCNTAIEDDLLCRTYRPLLEDAGFIWAPEKVARDFAYEGAGGEKVDKAFGFHAAYNFGLLGHDRAKERARLMMQSSYIRECPMMKVFCEKNPAVIKELLDEESGVQPVLMT